MSAFNSQLTIFKGYVCDKSYNSVFYSESASQVESFLKANFDYDEIATDLYMIRNNSIRVNHYNADYLRKYNYLMYKNYTNLQSSITFFCFIDDIIYINDDCAEIHFTIDIWNTWFNSITFKNCFIERQHSATDNFGENLQTEPLNFGNDFVYTNYIGYATLNDFIIVVGVNDDLEPNIIDKVYTPVKFYAYHNDVDGAQALSDYLAGFTENPNKITGVYMVPSFVIGDETVIEQFANGTPLNIFGNAANKTTTFATSAQALDAMDLENNKCFQYPFCAFHIDNGAGQELNLKYEFFENFAPIITFASTFNQPVKTVALPTNYKNIAAQEDHSQMITLDNYPICAFAFDAYWNWLINAGVPIVAQGVINMGGGVNTALTSTDHLTSIDGISPSGLMQASSLTGVGATVASYAAGAINSSLIQEPITKGNLNSGNINFAHNWQTFFTACRHYPEEIMKQIDSYFTRYGYAQNKIATPNFKARPKYTYIKATDINMMGNIPNYAREGIIQILNNGVTVWRQSAIDNFGDYSTNPIE